MLIDAHCHLDFPDFDVDRDAMFERAKAVGVGHFVVPGTTRARWPSVLALGERADTSVCLGLHPYFLDDHRLDPDGLTGGDDDLAALKTALEAHPEVVAVGECGIDARFEDTLEAQWALFKAQLRLAKTRNLPVVIHCVRANDQVAKCLKEVGLPAGGLIHAFAGSLQQAQRFLALGFVVGLGGAVTYERAQRLRRCVSALPGDAFVLETDSPDMPPAGFKGVRNEPSRLAQIADDVAALRHESRARVEEASTANAARVFRLDI